MSKLRTALIGAGAMAASAVLAVNCAQGAVAATGLPSMPTQAPQTAIALPSHPVSTTSKTLDAGKLRLDPRCITSGRVLCINKSTRKLVFVNAGKPIAIADARFGCPGASTRNGQFAIFNKDRHHVSGLYESAMPDSMFFSGGQAVHYSSDFAARGYNGCSHGCVNIRARKVIDYIFDHVSVGDRVVVYSR